MAFVLCLLFIRQAYKKSVPKRGKTYAKEPRGTLGIPVTGAARFALISARRGRWCSYIVLAAAFILTFLLGLVVSGLYKGNKQLEQLYAKAQIWGQVTNITGRQSTDLVVSAQNARLLWNSGLLSEMDVSLGWNYWFEEEMPYFGPEDSNSRNLWIYGQPELVTLNDLSASKTFYYGGLSEVEWLEGWDESFLKEPDKYDSILESLTFYGDSKGITVGGSEPLVYPCLVSRQFLDARNLDLEDTFEVSIRLKDVLEGSKNIPVSLMIVGTYTGGESQHTIYVPLSFWCSMSWITGEKAPLADGERPKTEFINAQDRDGYYYANTTFSTCRFALRSAYDLEAFREYLETQGISQVGHMDANRMTVVLMDESFTETAEGLKRYVTFGKILLPALCAALGLLGFVISWLMIHGRKMEVAIMRSLGASKKRTFASFFLEQAGLVFTGGLLGALILAAIPGGQMAGCLSFAAFCICYLAGTALAVLYVQKMKLMRILTQE